MHIVASESSRNAYNGDAIVVSNGEMVARVKGVHMSFLGDSGNETEKDSHAAVELEWKEAISLMDPALLIRQAKDRRGVHALLDRFSAICMLEASHRLAGISPNQAHLQKYRDWLKDVASDITAGIYLAPDEDEGIANMNRELRESIMAITCEAQTNRGTRCS